MRHDSEFLRQLAERVGEVWLLPIDQRQLSAELTKAHLTQSRFYSFCADVLNSSPENVSRVMRRRKHEDQDLPSSRTTPAYVIAMATAIHRATHKPARGRPPETPSDDALKAIILRIVSHAPMSLPPYKLEVVLDATGPVDLPRELHWDHHLRMVTCTLRRDCDVIVTGNGDGSVTRNSPAAGNAIRKGNGPGDAIREGDGSGYAVRQGVGSGHAIRQGRGMGSACRVGSGLGDARREGVGYGWAIHTSSGGGEAINESDGGGGRVYQGETGSLGAESTDGRDRGSE